MKNFLQKYFKKPKEKKITIIHADDHVLCRSGLRMGLADRPELEFIGESVNGLELLKLLETTIPDIVILNIAMPVMDGVVTLPEIKRRYPGLGVIILSMHNSPEMIARMMRLGANAYLTKNISSEEIYRAIRFVHEHGYYYTDAVERMFLDPDIKFEGKGRGFNYTEFRIINFLKAGKTKKEMASLMDLNLKSISALIDKLRKKPGRMPSQSLPPSLVSDHGVERFRRV